MSNNCLHAKIVVIPSKLEICETKLLGVPGLVFKGLQSLYESQTVN